MKDEENREYKVGEMYHHPSWGKCIVLELLIAEENPLIGESLKPYAKIYSLTYDRTVTISTYYPYRSARKRFTH